MKVLVLIAYLEATAAGRVDPSELITVHADFASADGHSRFEVIEQDEDDHAPWERATARLRWLAERMITHSSNLATDLVIERIGLDAVRSAGESIEGVEIHRWIDDQPAGSSGITNSVTAAGLATVLSRLWSRHLLSEADTETALDLLAANTWNDEIPRGLPPGTRVAHKNGWDTGIRHDAGIVLPEGRPPFVVSVLTTGLTDDDAKPLIAGVAAWAWDRLA